MLLFDGPSGSRVLLNFIHGGHPELKALLFISVQYWSGHHYFSIQNTKMSMTEGVLTVLPAPEGYEVNFENPPQVGAIPGYFVTGFGIALAASFLTMRLYTRLAITRNFGFEDGTVCRLPSSCIG